MRVIGIFRPGPSGPVPCASLLEVGSHLDPTSAPAVPAYQEAGFPGPVVMAAGFVSKGGAVVDFRSLELRPSNVVSQIRFYHDHLTEVAHFYRDYEAVYFGATNIWGPLLNMVQLPDGRFRPGDPLGGVPVIDDVMERMFRGGYPSLTDRTALFNLPNLKRLFGEGPPVPVDAARLDCRLGIDAGLTCVYIASLLS